MLVNVIAVLSIVLVVGGALFYIIRAKRKGQKCIGCPHSSVCGKTKKDGCSCEKENK